MMFHSILVNSASGTTQKSNELNFRMWFKYGLKAQKLQKQHALKGQKLLAQGVALG